MKAVDFRVSAIGRKSPLMSITTGLDNATLHSLSFIRWDQRTREQAERMTQYLKYIRKE